MTDPFTVEDNTWRQHARNIASGYGLALQNTTLDHVDWELTAFPVAPLDIITDQLHHAFRTMSRGWWKRNRT